MPLGVITGALCTQRQPLTTILCAQVLIDGVPLTEVDAQWYRSQIGVVAQDPRLFSNPISANITYGCSGKSQVCVTDQPVPLFVLNTITFAAVASTIIS